MPMNEEKALSLFDENLSTEKILNTLETEMKNLSEKDLEKAEKIIEDLGMTSELSKFGKRIVSVNLDSIKKQISFLPKPLAIAFAALVFSLYPSEAAWAGEVAIGKTVQQSTQDNSNGPIVYAIRPGDRLSKIAKKFHVSLQDLYKANPGLKKIEKRLRVGYKITIPQKRADLQYLSKVPGEYVVRSGDSAKTICEKAGIPLSHFLELNGLSAKEAELLYPGQRVKTFDMDRMIRAFIYVETGGMWNEKKRDTMIGDDGNAVGCLQFWPDTFSQVSSGSRNSRKDSVQAFKKLLTRYASAVDILSVMDILKKAKWNKNHSGKDYISAYLQDKGAGIPLK